jgi:methylphosphotriester-DNA--protein-cysteine methyltransferase
MPEPSRPFRFPDDPGHYGNRCAAIVIDVAHSVKRHTELSMVEMDLDSRLKQFSMAARRELLRKEEYDLTDAWIDAGLKGPEDYWREDDGEPKK